MTTPLIERFRLEPYRALFPLGWFFALWGTAIWLPLIHNHSASYPATIHSNLMLGGFLLSFAQGFLMTAIPRMSGTAQARPTEILLASLLAVAEGLLAATIGDDWPTHFVAICILVALLVFAGRRVMKRTKNPPGPFVLVAFGLFSGLIGNTLLVAGSFGAPALLTSLGHTLYFQAMILFLVFGVGSRLIPFLLQSESPHTFSESALMRILGVLGAIFALSYAIDLWMEFPLGAFMRAAIATWIAISVWRLHTRAQYPGSLKWGLKTSAWLILAGLWFAAIFPGQSVHWLHLTFVAGFGLMTLMIATRVTLAHGSHGLSLEKTSKALIVTAALILLAAVTRATAPLMPDIYLTHLGYAALVWIAALIVWGWFFLRKVFVKGRGPAHG